MEYLFFLGTNPALSAAEIWHYLSNKKISADYNFDLLPFALKVTTEIELREIIDKLGGVPLIGIKRGVISSLSEENIIAALKLEQRFNEDKKPLFSLSYGDSSGTGSITPRELRSLAVSIKKRLSLKGLRFITPQNGTAPTTAQLFNNKLPQEGVAIHIIKNDNEYIVVEITEVQDIRSYATRDRLRPEVDPGKGMLPVKLAQIFLNLASVPDGGLIYDPFCGSGTIISEALLKGYRAIASDISPKQVARTQENVEWLGKQVGNPGLVNNVVSFVQDVEKGFSKLEHNSIDAVVSEGWLGPGLKYTPSLSDIEKTYFQVQTILFAFLKNINNFLKKDGSILISLPAFRVQKRIIRAPFLQPDFLKLLPKTFSVEKIVPDNWDHQLFRETRQGQILYGRSDALVLRDILLLRKVS